MFLRTTSTPGFVRWGLFAAALLAPLLAGADPLGAAAIGGAIDACLLIVYLLVLGLVVLSYLRPASAGLYKAQLVLGGLCLWVGGTVLCISRETYQGASDSLDAVNCLFLVLLMVGAWLNGVRWARVVRPRWLHALAATVAAFALHCLALFLVRGHYTFSPNDGLYPAEPSFLGFALELLGSVGAWGIVRWQLGKAARPALWQPGWRTPLLAVAVFGVYCLLFVYVQRLEDWQAPDIAVWLGQGVAMAGGATALALRIFGIYNAPAVADDSVLP